MLDLVGLHFQDIDHEVPEIGQATLHDLPEHGRLPGDKVPCYLKMIGPGFQPVHVPGKDFLGLCRPRADFPRRLERYVLQDANIALQT
ncbi:hypothetical protein GO002_09370 [Streptomyces eurocidicus]|nr:hypothetical protein [Streptomyces eurocidicus]